MPHGSDLIFLLGCPRDSPLSLESGYFTWMCLGVGDSRSLSLDYIVSFQYADSSLCKNRELFTFFIYVLSVWLLIHTCLLCLLKTNQVRGAHHRCIRPCLVWTPCYPTRRESCLVAVSLTPSTWLLPDSHCSVALTFTLEPGDLTASAFHQQKEGGKKFVFSFPFLLSSFRMVS